MQPQDTTSPDIAAGSDTPARKWDDPEYRKAYFAAYNAARKDKTCEYDKSYREAHLEEKRAKDREYAASHREDARERATQWYRDHPEQAKASRKDWYQANLEKAAEYAKQYRLDHMEHIREGVARRRERIRMQHRERLRANPEANRARVRAWTKANPEKAKACRTNGFARRKARLLNCHTEPVDRAAIIARDKGVCGICGKKVSPKQIVLDHILPLARGGAHAPYNLQVAHARCNAIKGAGRLPSQLRLSI